MKKLASVLIVCALITVLFSACTVEIKNPLLEADVRAYILTNSEHVLQDEDIPKTTKTVLEASLANNEYESVQVVFQSDKKIKNLSVSLSPLKNKNDVEFNASNITIYRESYVKTEFASAPQLPLGSYPDALIPMFEDLNSCTVAAQQNQGYYITFHADNAEPGIYTGELTATYDGGVVKIPVSVEVWNFAIPVTPSFMSFFQLWVSDIWAYYSKMNSSLEGLELIQTFYDFLLDFRVNGGSLPIEAGSVDEYIQNAAKYFEDERVTSVPLPYYSSVDENGQVIHDNQNNELIQKLTEKGWINKAFYYLGHLIDEPSGKPEAIAKVKMYCDDIRTYTDIPHIVTAHIRNDLTGIVDGWCPQPDGIDEDVVRERQANGETVWWYTSCTPVYPYPNYHTDNLLLAPRIYRWMQEDYGITGDLLWATTIYSKWNGSKYVSRDVWSDPHTSTVEIGQAVGDGFLIYPGTENDGVINRNMPIPTMRLMAIRDGAEDLEYLKLLEQKYTNIIEKYNLSVSVDEIMDTYYTPLYEKTNAFSSDPELIQNMRKILAAEIMSEDDCIIMSRVEKNKTGSSGRAVEVLGAENAEVYINGEKTTKRVFDVDKDMTVTVAVNGNVHNVILSQITETEYNYIENSYKKNNSGNTIKADILFNEKTDGFDISVYTNKTATVKIGDEKFERVSEQGEKAKFTLHHDFSGGKAAVCDIEITVDGKPETFSYFLVKRATQTLEVVNFSDPKTFEKLAETSSNKFGELSNTVPFA